MLLTILANLVQVEPVVPPTPVTTDTHDGVRRHEFSQEDELKKRGQLIKKTNEEVFIIVNSIMTCLN